MEIYKIEFNYEVNQRLDTAKYRIEKRKERITMRLKIININGEYEVRDLDFEVVYNNRKEFSYVSEDGILSKSEMAGFEEKTGVRNDFPQPEFCKNKGKSVDRYFYEADGEAKELHLYGVRQVYCGDEIRSYATEVMVIKDGELKFQKTLSYGLPEEYRSFPCNESTVFSKLRRMDCLNKDEDMMVAAFGPYYVFESGMYGASKNVNFEWEFRTFFDGWLKKGKKWNLPAPSNVYYGGAEDPESIESIFAYLGNEHQGNPNKVFYVQREKNAAVIRCYGVTYRKDSIADIIEYMRIRITEKASTTYRRTAYGWVESDFGNFSIYHALGCEDDMFCIGTDEDLPGFVGRYDKCLMAYDGRKYYSFKLIYAAGYAVLDNLLGIYPYSNILTWITWGMFMKETIPLKKVFAGAFGMFNPKASSFADAVDLPQWMIEKIEMFPKITDEEEDSCHIRAIISCEEIRILREILGPKHFKNLDEDIFDEYLDYLQSAYAYDMDGAIAAPDVLGHLVEHYGKQDFLLYLQKIMDIMKADVGRDIYADDKLDIYYDYLYTIGGAGFGRFSWDIEACSLVEIHGEVMELFNMLADKGLNKTLTNYFANHHGEWRKYSFSYKELTVSSTSKPWNVINEVSKLHLCVKTFVETMVKGDTAILFIHQKRHRNEPYFVLEIRNGRISQCRGFDNRKPSEDVLELLREFCKKKNVKNRKEFCSAV